jgi:hypothetical protein
MQEMILSGWDVVRADPRLRDAVSANPQLAEAMYFKAEFRRLVLARPSVLELLSKGPEALD